MTNKLANLEEIQKIPELSMKEKISKIKEIVKEFYPFNKVTTDSKSTKTLHLKFIQDRAVHSIIQTEVWKNKIIEKLNENNIEYVSALWQTETKQGYGPYQLFYMIILK